MPVVQRIPRKNNYGATFQQDRFYQSPTWKALRKAHYSFSDNVLCFYCKLSGITRMGNICDHFRPRRLYPELALDGNNLRSACAHCDSKKRIFEKGIATREQFESKIEEFLIKTFG